MTPEEILRIIVITRRRLERLRFAVILWEGHAEGDEAAVEEALRKAKAEPAATLE